MNSFFINKLRAITLSVICLLFSFQINNNIATIDLEPQFKNASIEQIIEFEDHFYQDNTVSNLSAFTAKKRNGSRNKHSYKSSLAHSI